MTKKINNIKSFPADRFNNNWPFAFDRYLSRDLFYMNSYQPYSSLTEFLIPNIEEYSNSGETCFDGFFIEDNKSYYKEVNGQIYSLENVPYSSIVYSAIQHELICFSDSTFHWLVVLNYLLFTSFPVLKILEEGNFIKLNKKVILDGFYRGFNNMQNISRLRLENFFLNSPLKSQKEKLYNILIYSQIPENEGKSVTKKCSTKKSFFDIILCYKDILEKLDYLEE